MEILQPPGWPRPKGYANGIATEGRLVFVAGQVGWDTNEVVTSDNLVDQIDQALENVLAILKEAGASAEHIARMTWYITDRDAYNSSTKDIGTVWRRHMGRHYPAMSVVQVAGLIEPGAQVEIEATAVVPG